MVSLFINVTNTSLKCVRLLLQNFILNNNIQHIFKKMYSLIHKMPVMPTIILETFDVVGMHFNIRIIVYLVAIPEENK